MSLKSVCNNRSPALKFPFLIVLSVNYKQNQYILLIHFFHSCFLQVVDQNDFFFLA